MKGPDRLYDYAGPVWYQRYIDIPASWRGQRVTLFFWSVAGNPFEFISKVDTRGRERFHRRASSDDEAKRLLAGPRKLLYLLALHTGLRRSEINALHGSDYHSDTANPYWELPAAFVDNRKEQPPPLHPELAAEMQKRKVAGILKLRDLVFPERAPPRISLRLPGYTFRLVGID